MHKSHDLTKDKKIIKIVVTALALGLVITIFDFVTTRINFDGILERNSAGSGNISEVLELEYLDESEDMEVTVSEQKLSTEEIETKFDQAINEIDSTYLGKNTSADDVQFDLNIQTEYADGLILAQWKFDKYEIISQEGKINYDNVPDSGEIVLAEVLLNYEDSQRIYTFSFVVNPLGIDTNEGQIRAIQKAVESEDENTRDTASLKLPTAVENMNLTWKRKMNFRGLQIILLGIAAAIAIVVGEKQEEKKQKALITAERERDYPMIVSELSILMGAGMSFRKAIERISLRYQEKISRNNSKKSAGYDEILLTHRRMQEGMGELKAIEEMGKSSESKDYRKLATMLIQNLRKGSKDLIECLEKEELNAFELKKQRAIRAGEEASTKLLIPMGGMLLIIIVILIVPAMLQMKG